MAYDFGLAFDRSFDSGYRLGEDIDEKRRKKAVRQGLKALDAETTAAPDAAQGAAFAQENAALAAADNREFGTDNKAADYQYGEARLVAARGLSDAERLRGTERVYRENGFDDRADAAGQRAMTAKRQETEDVRTATRDAQAAKVYDLQMKGLNRAESKATAADTFSRANGQYMTEVESGKTPFNVAKLFEIAQASGVSPDEAMEAASKRMGFTKEMAQAKVQEKLTSLAAAAEKGLPAMLALHDPNPNDNIVPTAVTNKDGTTSIMYGGKEEFKLPPAGPGVSVAGMLFQEIKGRFEGNPMAAGMQFLAMEAQRANIDQSKAAVRQGEAQTQQGWARVNNDTRSTNATIANSGRAAAADARSISEKAQAGNAAMALYKEQNPNATNAQLEAVRRGVLAPFKETKNEYTTNTDSMGMTITRTNKDTGAVDVIDPKTGQVRASIAAPGASAKPAVKPASESAAHAEARNAVAKGGNKDAVNQRLKQMGYKPI